MPRLDAFGIATLTGLTLVPVVAAAAEQPGVWTHHDEYVLGTRATFVVTATEEAHALEAVSAARAEIERLDLVFNGRKPGSELVALNSAKKKAVSSELLEVMQQAEDLRRQSGEAYSGRMGEILKMWREAKAAPPDKAALSAAAEAARAPVHIDAETRTIVRPKGVRFDLDGFAKGYIVDRALRAGLDAAPVKGLMVDIGGDMACAGVGPEQGAWTVGVPEPSLPFVNAPLVAEVRLKDQAIATSGKGPRDRIIDGERYSPTVSPLDGWASEANMSATVVAKTAAQADALATALLVMQPNDGLALAEATPGVEARLTDHGGIVRATTGWRTIATEPQAHLIKVATTPGAPPPNTDPNRWLPDWAVEIIYNAPDRVAERSSDFRSPYMAMWITDKDMNPVRTLVLVGRTVEWQKDNFIWWGMYKDKAPKLVQLRSTATALSGQYPTYWPGYNDDWKFMKQGQYILHIETSRERGKHTHRTVPLTLGKDGFKVDVPKTAEGGGVQLTYGKRD